MSENNDFFKLNSFINNFNKDNSINYQNYSDFINNKCFYSCYINKKYNRWECINYDNYHHAELNLILKGNQTIGDVIANKNICENITEKFQIMILEKYLKYPIIFNPQKNLD